MSITQFSPSADLSQPFVIPAGMMLETDPSLAERCCFRTSQATYLLPIAIQEAELGQNLPDHIRPMTSSPNASGLKLTLRCLDDDMTFAQLKAQKLRLYLRGQWHYTLPLYELLLQSSQAVALLENFQSTDPVWLAPDCIEAVGFQEDEGLLSYDSRSALAYRLLTEYFIYPEKFLFIDINLEKVNFTNFNNTLNIIIYLRKSLPQLTNHVNANTFALNAVPVVNLFSTTIEPVNIDHKHYQYPLLPDHRRPEVLEIYSIDEVTSINANNDIVSYLPFYGLQDRSHDAKHHAFWCSHRKKQAAKEDVNYAAQTYLSFVNLDLMPSLPETTTLYIKATCMNRTLPENILYAEDRIILQLMQESAPVIGARFLLVPTPLRAPLAEHQSMSALIAHLGLNHLSLIDPAQGIQHLQKMLQLYQLPDAENSNLSDSLISMETAKIIRRMHTGIYQAPCQGIKLQLKIDERYFPGQTAYLFARILEKFFQLYVTVNSFIELEIINSENQRTVFHGKPVAGDKYLL